VHKTLMALQCTTVWRFFSANIANMQSLLLSFMTAMHVRSHLYSDKNLHLFILRFNLRIKTKNYFLLYFTHAAFFQPIATVLTLYLWWGTDRMNVDFMFFKKHFALKHFCANFTNVNVGTFVHTSHMRI
jgi:hypothetical protein